MLEKARSISVHSLFVCMSFFGICIFAFPRDFESYFSLDYSHDESSHNFIPFAQQGLRFNNASLTSSTSIVSLNVTLNQQNFIPPKILIWTPSISIRNISDDSLIRTLRNSGEQCPYKCEIHGRERINENEASAIVFHSRTLSTTDLPTIRREDQIYVWLCHEAQNRCGDNDEKLTPTFFNTSMTNLRDDKAYNFGYGEVVRTENEDLLRRISDRKWTRIWQRKKKLGLAIISNCYTHSKREYYLKELSLHVKLSLLGSCFGSHRICSGSNNSQGCVDKLLESHFFYFAFENSVCKDYITEKVFDRLQKNIIPVVLRRRILEGVIPSGAFIAADDFATPKDLADYLVAVSKNETLYRSYFLWRDSHALASHITMRGNGICALCSDLWTKTPRTSSNYVAREHYSPRMCEADVGCKLVGKRCRSERNQFLQESRSYYMGF